MKSVSENSNLTYKESAQLTEAVESAKKASMKIGESIYRNAGQQQQSNTNQEQTQNQDNNNEQK